VVPCFSGHRTRCILRRIVNAALWPLIWKLGTSLSQSGTSGTKIMLSVGDINHLIYFPEVVARQNCERGDPRAMGRNADPTAPGRACISWEIIAMDFSCSRLSCLLSSAALYLNPLSRVQ